MFKEHIIFLLMGVLSLYGCSAVTSNQANKSGKPSLKAREIFELVSGNSLELNAYDFSGKIYYDSSGEMAGIDNEGQRDTGSWDINNKDQLCMKFRLWYYGDLKCYSITARDNGQRLNFYTTNGASYYTGILYTGDIAQIKAIIPQKRDEKYLRKKFAAEQPSASDPSTSDIQDKDRQVTTPSRLKDGVTNSSSGGTLTRLARNCPGCNLSGAQLKEADLVNANLSGADLSGADLRYANLRRANLQGANLSGARLNHANLPGANLSDCNLSFANLSGANLLLADVTGADLKGAILTGAYLENIKGLKDN